MGWKIFAEVVTKLAWPITSIVLAFVLRWELRTIWGRMKSAKLPGGAEHSFGQCLIDKESGGSAALVRATSTGSVNPNNVGNIY